MSIKSDAILELNNLENSKVYKISSSQFRKKLSGIINKKPESIRGTLFTDSKRLGFLNDTGYFYLKGTMYHRHVFKDLYKVCLNSENDFYDTIEKEDSRKFVFNNINHYKKPKVLTLPSNRGLDVKYCLSKNNNSIIHCIERNKTVLDEFRKLNLNCVSFLGNFYDIVKSNKYTYDILFYDSTSYMCESVYHDMVLINQKRLAKEVNINLMDIKKIRNTGAFANHFRNKYSKNKNPTLTILKDCLFGYELVSQFRYKNTNTTYMNIFKFKLIS